MNGRWKLILFGILVFQWVQAYVFWHLMDVIRLQAEGSWLHETAWGPETMLWVWIIGGMVSLATVVVLVLEARAFLEPRAEPAGPREGEP